MSSRGLSTLKEVVNSIRIIRKNKLDVKKAKESQAQLKDKKEGTGKMTSHK